MANIQERISKDGVISYRVQVRLKGYPAQTATFTRKTDAKKWIQQTESAIREGRHFKTVESKKHTLGELIDRYIETVVPHKKKHGVKQAAQLMWWKQELGVFLLSDITPSLIAERRDKLLQGTTYRGTKRSSSTVVRYMAALSYAYTIAVTEWGWIEDSPLRKVSKPSEPRGRIRFLDESERNRLLETCKKNEHPYLYIIVVLAISTGMRYSEIMNLTWSVIELDRKRIILHETKNGERRVVPLTSLALDLLRNHKNLHRMDSVLLFPALKGQKPQKPASLRSVWDRVMKECGIVNFKFHDLRHCCESYLAMNNAWCSKKEFL
jgi:integrase